jgi:hypothetical protein
MMGHGSQSLKPTSPSTIMHNYLSTNDLKVCTFLINMLGTYLDW